MVLLAMPVLAEQMLNTCVGLVDTYLAGRISTAALTAVGLGAYVDWLVSMIVLLVGTGTTALVARYYGAGDPQRANHFANQSLLLAVLVGFGALVLISVIAPMLATYCNMRGEAHDVTVQYLRTAALSHPAMAILIVGSAALRGVGNMRTPMAVYAVLNVLNIAASWMLVWGWGPLPALGTRGIAMGTVFARVFGAMLILAILLRGVSDVRIRLSELPVQCASVLRILRIGVPAAFDGAVLWTGHFLFLGIVSNLAEAPLGDAYLAVHIISVRVEALTYLPATAWATATATLVGQALGAEDPDRAKRAGHEGVFQCGIFAIGIGAAFFVFAEQVFRLMSDDPLVHAEGPLPFRIVAILQPTMVASIVYVHGMRGAGDTRFPLLITIVGVILIRLPLGYLGGVILGGGLIGAWAGLYADMLWRATAAAVRFQRGKWLTTRV